MDQRVNFSMYGSVSSGQKHTLQHVWNVLLTKTSVSAYLEFVVVKTVSFSIVGMYCGSNSQFQYV
jgi:hypothetical protein